MKFIEFWKSLNWPQVVLLTVTIVGVVMSLREVPPDFWDRIDWKWWAWFLLAGTGVGGSALADKLLKGGPK